MRIRPQKNDSSTSEHYKLTIKSMNDESLWMQTIRRKYLIWSIVIVSLSVIRRVLIDDTSAKSTPICLIECMNIDVIRASEMLTTIFKNWIVKGQSDNNINSVSLKDVRKREK